MQETIVKQTDSDIIFTRTFDAPQALVFKMFTQAEHLKQWWGPKNWPVTECSVDLKPQGTWSYVLANEDGEKVHVKATYQKIDEPHTLVFTDNIMPSATTTVTFTPQGNTTTVTSHIVYQDPQELAQAAARGMIAGMRETWEQLAILLKTMPAKLGDENENGNV